MPKVQSVVKTQAEKNLVSALISAVNTKIDNPSAVVDTLSIKTQYNNLSTTEKSDFQSAMFSKFSLNTLVTLRKLF